MRGIYISDSSLTTFPVSKVLGADRLLPRHFAPREFCAHILRRNRGSFRQRVFHGIGYRIAQALQKRPPPLFAGKIEILPLNRHVPMARPETDVRYLEVVMRDQKQHLNDVAPQAAQKNIDVAVC